jgi:hypothetical protein
MGPIATVIENELLGFHADKAAYPLRQTSGLQDELDLEKVLAEARQLISDKPPSPTLVSLPTPGMVMEAITGRCDACEEYIQDSRLIDLRSQEAKAVQEEAEAERRRKRVDQNVLSDPIRERPPKLVIEVQGLGDAETPDNP